MQSLANPELSSLKERYRKRVVSAFVLIYLFILFEGVLRKWLLPGLSSAINRGRSFTLRSGSR